MNIDVCDDGPYRHKLCRKKGSGRIARAQKDVSIDEVHATRVSMLPAVVLYERQHAKSDSESSVHRQKIFFT